MHISNTLKPIQYGLMVLCSTALLFAVGCSSSPGKKAVRGATVGAATVGVTTGVKKSAKKKTKSKAEDAVDLSKPGSDR